MKTFISHSHKDAAFAAKLAKDLELRGLEVFYAGWSLRPGDSLIQKIADGITSSGALIVVLSPNSVKSRWVKMELSLAFSDECARRHISVIPVLLETCEFPSMFQFLGSTVYADFRRDYVRALKRLLVTLGVRPSRRGIKRVTGDPTKLKFTNIDGFLFAMYIGMTTYWSYDRLTNVVSLYVRDGVKRAGKILSFQIPLTEREAKLVRRCREKGGWECHELYRKEGKWVAVIIISFIDADLQVINLLWFINKSRLDNLYSVTGINEPP